MKKPLVIEESRKFAKLAVVIFEKHGLSKEDAKFLIDMYWGRVKEDCAYDIRVGKQLESRKKQGNQG